MTSTLIRSAVSPAAFSASQATQDTNVANARAAQNAALLATAGANLIGFDAAINYAAQTIGWTQRQGAINVEWFVGADNTGATDMTAIMVAAAALGHAIYLPAGTWAMNWKPTTRIMLIGDGSTVSLVKPFSTATDAAITYKGTLNWTYHSEVRGIGFVGTGMLGVGFAFAQTNPNNYVVNDEYINNVKFFGCRFNGLDKGVLFPSGNIGSEFYSCGFNSNRYGVYALNNKFGGTAMHAGNKYFYGGEFDANVCAVYINNTQDGFGGINFTDTIIESNVIGIYLLSTAAAVVPIELRGVWFERNGAVQATPTATLDVWTGAVKSTAIFNAHTLWLEGATQQVIVTGGMVQDIYLSATNSRVLVKESRVEVGAGNSGAPFTVVDALSSIQLIDCSSNGGFGAAARVIVSGKIDLIPHLITDTGTAGARAALIPHRYNKQAGYGGAGTFLPLTAAAAYTGSFVGNGTVVADGIVYPNCNQFNVPFTLTSQYCIVTPANQVTSAGWYVATIDAKWVSGAQPTLSFGDLGANQMFAAAALPAVGEWYTVGSIAQAAGASTLTIAINPATAAASVFDLSAFQCRRFDTRHEAQDFLESLVYVGA